MILIDIIMVLILVIAFIGGLIEGSVKSFFRLLGVIIALPLTGFLYPFLANVLSFLPGENWENFVSFIIILGILSTILYWIFFIPRKFMEKISIDIGILRLIGGCLNVINTAIGMVVFTQLLETYPIMEWLEEIVVQSKILAWLVAHLEFIQVLLPELLRRVPATVVNGALFN